MEAGYRVLRHNIRANLINGIAWAIGFNLVLPFIGVMAAHMGATNTDFALLSSIPALLTILLTLPAAFIIEQFKQQKRVVAAILMGSRLCYLLLAFLPWMPKGELLLLIILSGIYNATSSVVGVAWQAMMGEIIPTSYRNRVFARRNIWSNGFGMVVVLLAGFGIDHLQYPTGYQVMYTAGFLASLIEIWYFLRLRIPSEEKWLDTKQPADQIPSVQSKNLLHLFIDNWKIELGRPFYLFCLSAVLFIFAWQAAWPIYLKVKVGTLQASNTWISVDTVIGALGSLLGFQPWARFADRKGNGFTTFMAALLLAFTPFLWIYSPNMYWVSIYDFIGGFITAGFNQSIFNHLLEIIPTGVRQRAIAIYTSLTQVSAVVAPLAGMALYSHFSYFFTMSTIGIARIIGSFCFLIIMLSPTLSSKPQATKNDSQRLSV